MGPCLEKITPSGTKLKLVDEHRLHPRFFVHDLTAEIHGQIFTVINLSLSGCCLKEFTSPVNLVYGKLRLANWEQPFEADLRYQGPSGGLHFRPKAELQTALTKLLTVPENDLLLVSAEGNRLQFKSPTRDVELEFNFNSHGQVTSYLLHHQGNWLRWNPTELLRNGQGPADKILWTELLSPSFLQFFREIIEEQECFTESFKDWLKATLTW